MNPKVLLAVFNRPWLRQHPIQQTERSSKELDKMRDFLRQKEARRDKEVILAKADCFRQDHLPRGAAWVFQEDDFSSATRKFRAGSLG